MIRDNYSSARKLAEELDSSFKATGKVIGPLHGIPFTIKDAFRIQHRSTSYGFPGFQFLPGFDNCEVVERLTGAGAILIGQTNVPLSCFDWQTNSPLYGLTKNPHNPGYTVGGSSGGSAASVAAALTPFEIGSDVAGSIRYPAHCCGIFGFRPSHNLVRFNDIGPSIHKQSFQNLAVAGPMARSIEDLEIVLGVLTNSVQDTKPNEKLRIAYTLEWDGIGVDADSRNAIDAFLLSLRNDGHNLNAFSPRIDFAHCEEVYGVILGYEYKKMIPYPFRLRPFMDVFNYFFNTRRFRDGQFKQSFQKGLLGNRQAYNKALIKAENLRSQFQTELENFDLWLTPVSPGPAISHQKTGSALTLDKQVLPYAEYLGHFLTSTALFHHPILVAPIGVSGDQLPIGVQMHGKPGKDWQLLADCKKLKENYSLRTPII